MRRAGRDGEMVAVLMWGHGAAQGELVCAPSHVKAVGRDQEGGGRIAGGGSPLTPCGGGEEETEILPKMAFIME